MNDRKFGWIKEPCDSRDKVLEFENKTYKKMPEIIDYRNYFMSDIYDQGKIGSCTAISSISVYEYIQRKKGINSYNSTMFLYYNTRLSEGTEDQDNGAYIRNTVKTMNKIGNSLDFLWPYTKHFSERPTDEAYHEAWNNKIKSYHFIEPKLGAFRRALAHGYLIIFGFEVTETFANVGSDGIMPEPGGDVYGGHAVVCCGYDNVQKHLIIRNSWGLEFGHHGYFYMKYEYMKKAGISDCWVIK